MTHEEYKVEGGRDNQFAIPNNPREALGVDENATQEEINEAYKSLAQKYHPDVNSDDEYASEWFRAITEARDILVNPEKNAGKSHFFGERKTDNIKQIEDIKVENNTENSEGGKEVADEKGEQISREENERMAIEEIRETLKRRDGNSEAEPDIESEDSKEQKAGFEKKEPKYVWFGSRKKMTYEANTKYGTCPRCKGAGSVWWFFTCNVCRGLGAVPVSKQEKKTHYE